MKYLIVQDWESTHGNHAGMVHMCQLLVKNWPQEYTVIVMPVQSMLKPHKSQIKILNAFYLIINKIISTINDYYRNVVYPKKYLRVCREMLNTLQDNDKVFLMEYAVPVASQLELAYYIKKRHPLVQLNALCHLTPSTFELFIKSNRTFLDKWMTPIDNILTLGSSLSNYFISKGISSNKVKTLFHYVDLEYYLNNNVISVHRPMTIIAIGALQRDFKMLSSIVNKLPEFHWIICKGRQSIDDLFEKNKNVELLGYIDEEELKYKMLQADISLNILIDTVGSNVITTSMATGLAIVVSDVGSIRDYCTNDNAIFCSNNVESFVSSLKLLQNDQDLILKMKQNSLNRANNFSISLFHEYIMNL